MVNLKNVVLAHDSLTQLGGAEKVVDVLHGMFPDAPVYTTVLDNNLKKKYIGWDIRTTWLQKIYNWYPHFQKLLPFIPAAILSLKIEPVGKGLDPSLRGTGRLENRHFQDGTIFLSSSSAFAKAFRKPEGSTHINYCHTPTRFLWTDFEYIKQEVPVLLRPFATLYFKWMKHWDYQAAQRVDYFIANSKEVQKRIKQFYNRDSVVIYPPVDTDFWSNHKSQILNPKLNYFLIVGRLQAHKRTELIIEIFNELGLPLHIVGTGRQEKYLKSIAKPNITFYGRITDEELREQYSGAQALIYPQIEDFGMSPIEAAACGTPSIGIAKAGSLETIVPRVTGELFGNVVSPFMGSSPNRAADESANYPTVDQIKSQIKQIISSWNPQKYSPDVLRSHAEKFSKQKFKSQIQEFLMSPSTK